VNQPRPKTVLNFSVQHAESPEHPEAGSSKTVTEPDSLRDLPKFEDPVIPPINSYGTIPSTPSHRSILRRASFDSLASSIDSGSSIANETRPLLPNSILQRQKTKGIFESISGDLIPFGGFFRSITGFFRRTKTLADQSVLGDIEGSNIFRTQSKDRPRIAGGGENIPLEILRALTCWLSVLEERGSLYGMLCTLKNAKYATIIYSWIQEQH
jgi:ion channel-forming bestrophin family protein